MSQEWLWVIIIIVGLLTFGLRLSFMVFMGKMRVSSIVQRGLRFVPIAALSALIVPALFFKDGVLDVSLSNTRLLASILAILVACVPKMSYSQS